ESLPVFVFSVSLAGGLRGSGVCVLKGGSGRRGLEDILLSAVFARDDPHEQSCCERSSRNQQAPPIAARLGRRSGFRTQDRRLRGRLWSGRSAGRDEVSTRGHRENVGIFLNHAHRDLVCEFKLSQNFLATRATGNVCFPGTEFLRSQKTLVIGSE